MYICIYIYVYIYVGLRLPEPALDPLCPTLSLASAIPRSPSWHRRLRAKRAVARRRLRLGLPTLRDLCSLREHHGTAPLQRASLAEQIRVRMGKKGHRERTDNQWYSSDSWSYWGAHKGKPQWDGQGAAAAPQPNASRFPTYQQTKVTEDSSAPAVEEDVDQAGSDVAQTSHFTRDLQRVLTQCRKAEQRLRRLQDQRSTKDKQWQQYQRELKAAFLEQKKQYTRDSAVLDRDLEQALHACNQAVAAVQDMASGRAASSAPMQVVHTQAEEDAWDQLVGPSASPDMHVSQDAVLAQALQAAHALAHNVQEASLPATRQPPLITVTPKRGTSQGTPRSAQRPVVPPVAAMPKHSQLVGSFPATLLPGPPDAQYLLPTSAAVDPYMPSPSQVLTPPPGRVGLSPKARSPGRPKQRTSVKESAKVTRVTQRHAEAHVASAEQARQQQLQMKRDQLSAGAPLPVPVPAPLHTGRPPELPLNIILDDDRDVSQPSPSSNALGGME